MNPQQCLICAFHLILRVEEDERVSNWMSPQTTTREEPRGHHKETLEFSRSTKPRLTVCFLKCFLLEF